MIKGPFFSIIIPVYNGMPLLEQCLSSVETQTCKDFEVVIIDDGSTDESGSFCDSWCDLDPERRRCFHKSNEGLLLARRDGLLHATGTYICFIDSDDMLDVDALASLKKAALASHCDFILFNYYRDPLTKQAIIKHNLPHVGLYSGDDYHFIKETASYGESNNLWTKCIKSTLFKKDETDYPRLYRGLMHGEDWLQFLPIVDLASSAFYLQDAFYYYRINDGASTSHYRNSQLNDLITVFNVLIYYSNAWGGSCPDNAKRAILRHLTYIASSLGLESDSDLIQKDLELIHRVAFRFLGSESWPDDDLRIDLKIIAKCIRNSNGIALSLFSHFFNRVKKTISKIDHLA